LGLALAVVEDDGALPTPLLIVVEFAQMGDDALPRSSVRSPALDQREVNVRLTVLGSV
jgi:hypothetical protein